jgi:hypothetical protein
VFIQSRVGLKAHRGSKDKHQGQETKMRTKKETVKSATSGFVVVDFSTGWERVLHLSKEGWLGQASENYPVTIFKTEQEAKVAILATKEFASGSYSWSHNDYRVLPFYGVKP